MEQVGSGMYLPGGEFCPLCPFCTQPGAPFKEVLLAGYLWATPVSRRSQENI